MSKRIVSLCVALILFSGFSLSLISAEDVFGFDGGDGSSASGALAQPAVSPDGGMTIHGRFSAGTLQYGTALDDPSELLELKTGSLFSGRLDLSARGTNADAEIHLDLDGEAIASGADLPSIIDEAFVRFYFGKLDLETGLRKLTWGKADSQGPLDVINPLDLTDLTVTDSLARKIARPMVHASWSLGSYTKLEAVVIPSFEGHRIATEGRWAPLRVTELPTEIIAAVPAGPWQSTIRGSIAAQLAAQDMNTLYPDTSALEYSQAGLRFTTTVASNDIGFQYFYGNLSRPAISITGIDTIPPDVKVKISYNRYHQIGGDWAAVLKGFNVRAELAGNITEDLSGDNGAVYNPSLLWSAGFDRDLFALINVNAQAAGSVRLMDGKVGSTLSDTEAGSGMTSTKITLQLSRKIFKDALEVKASGIYGMEDVDFLIIPSVVWTKGDIEAELTGGIFGGKKDGELGQYYKNEYVKASITFKF